MNNNIEIKEVAKIITNILTKDCVKFHFKSFIIILTAEE